jgi:hypothetical protein
MAISGLSVVGRDKFGVFPLRGKLLNVRDVSAGKIADNEEITNIKSLGLKNNKRYTSVDELRYGKSWYWPTRTSTAHIRVANQRVLQSARVSFHRRLLTMATPIVKVKDAQSTHSIISHSTRSGGRILGIGMVCQVLQGWALRPLPKRRSTSSR